MPDSAPGRPEQPNPLSGLTWMHRLLQRAWGCNTLQPTQRDPFGRSGAQEEIPPSQHAGCAVLARLTKAERTSFGAARSVPVVGTARVDLVATTGCAAARPGPHRRAFGSTGLNCADPTLKVAKQNPDRVANELRFGVLKKLGPRMGRRVMISDRVQYVEDLGHP